VQLRVSYLTIASTYHAVKSFLSHIVKPVSGWLRGSKGRRTGRGVDDSRRRKIGVR